jgi:malate dehydrogenase (oxaloacetate-decarboxylating)(NADP+)
MRDEISLQLFIGNLENEKEFLYDAQKLMRERNYFAAMMVNEGDADGLVTGHSRSYSSVVKPMLQLVDKAGADIIATTNMMMTARGPMFLSQLLI